MTTTSKPELQGSVHEDSGYDGRYRRYTVNHIPFDAVPAYEDGGPSTVVIDGWCMSTSSLSAMSSPSVRAADDGLHTLSLFPRTSPIGEPFACERHALDGGKYPTRQDASRAAYEAGTIAFMIYEKDAARFGL